MSLVPAATAHKSIDSKLPSVRTPAKRGVGGCSRFRARRVGGGLHLCSCNAAGGRWMVGRDALRLECPVLLELRIHWASQTFYEATEETQEAPRGSNRGEMGKATVTARPREAPGGRRGSAGWREGLLRRPGRGPGPRRVWRPAGHGRLISFYT